MFSLKSKTYTKISLTLSTITILFTSFYFIQSMRENPLFLALTMAGCWMSVSANLIISTKIEPQWLKRSSIFLNLFCVLGSNWFLYLSN